MSPTLEQYFKERVTLPENGKGAYSEAERAFLSRYMGEDFEAALAGKGLDRPAKVESVTGPLAPQPPAAAPPVRAADEGNAGAARTPDTGDAPDADKRLEAELRQAETVRLVGFRLAGQELAVPIAQVQEVLRAVPVTKLPAAPPHILGILNLRGRVIPMVDLAAIMDFSGKRGENRFVIVCRCRDMLAGLMVESLSTMYQAAGRDVEWGLEARAGVASELVSGLLKTGGALVAILSVDSFFQKVLKS